MNPFSSCMNGGLKNSPLVLQCGSCLLMFDGGSMLSSTASNAFNDISCALYHVNFITLNSIVSNLIQPLQMLFRRFVSTLSCVLVRILILLLASPIPLCCYPRGCCIALGRGFVLESSVELLRIPTPMCTMLVYLCFLGYR